MQQNRPVSPKPKAKATILVVDDSPTIRKLVSMTLESKGYHVIVACDGVDGLAKMQEGMPDLILSDITMPRLDGYQFCKVVKSNKDTKHIPVIMLSGNDGLFDKVRGKMVGSANYITKPFEPNHLVKEIEKHVKTDRVDAQPPAAASRQPAPAAPKQPAPPPRPAAPAPPLRQPVAQQAESATNKQLLDKLSGIYIPSQSLTMDAGPGKAPSAPPQPSGPVEKPQPVPQQPQAPAAKRPISRPKRDDEPEIKIFYNNEPAEEHFHPETPPEPPAAKQPGRTAAPTPTNVTKEFDLGGGLSFKVVTPEQQQAQRPKAAMPQAAPRTPQAQPATPPKPAPSKPAPAPPVPPTPQQHTSNIKAKCTGCGTIYSNIKLEHIGKYARCKKCGVRFLIG